MNHNVRLAATPSRWILRKSENGCASGVSYKGLDTTSHRVCYLSIRLDSPGHRRFTGAGVPARDRNRSQVNVDSKVLIQMGGWCASLDVQPNRL